MRKPPHRSPGVGALPEMPAKREKTVTADARARKVCEQRAAGQPMTMIAAHFGVTRSRAYQMYWRGLDLIARERSNDPINELSARVRNALNALGCSQTPAGVARHFRQMPKQQILRIPNMGIGSRVELSDWLVRHGQRPLPAV
jgi:hypothetical protein